jgi:hypothetical protein
MSTTRFIGGRRKPRRPPKPEVALARAEVAAQILELRLRGASFLDISKRVQMSPASVANSYYLTIKNSVPAPLREEASLGTA